MAKTELLISCLNMRAFVCFVFFRDTVDMLNALYNQVDEEVHKLVILSNKSQKDLESLLEVRKFEEQTQQVASSFHVQF